MPVSDTFIAALNASRKRLSTKAADTIAARLRSASADMVPGDHELLKATAERLEAVSTRVKAAELNRVSRRRDTSKAGPSPRLGPSDAELVRQWDEWKMSGWSR